MDFAAYFILAIVLVIIGFALLLFVPDDNLNTNPDDDDSDKL